jgi:uncharacterized membrane protein YczE/cytidylate kinase
LINLESFQEGKNTAVSTRLTNTLRMAVRYLVFMAGLFIMALGVGLSVRAGLGTTSISSVPLVLSFVTPWTLGQILTVVNTSFIIIQLLLLRKKFPPIQFLQIPAALLFGWFCDIGLSILSGINPEHYITKLFLTLASTAVVAFGIFLEVKPNVVMLSGEGIVKAISIVTKRNFGTLKIAFDSTFVMTAICLSFILLHRIEGVREGTILAAFLVGTFVRFFNQHLTIFNRLIAPEEEQVAEWELPAALPVIITIARQYGSGGHAVGEMLAARLGWKLYDKEIISEVARTSGLSEEAVSKIDEQAPGWLQGIYLNSNEYISEPQGQHDQVFQQEVRIILHAARTGSCIIVGRLANFILKNTPNVISVFLHANEDYRIKRVMRDFSLTEEQALHEIRRMDANRRRFCHRRTGKDWSQADNYHLSFDSAMFTDEQLVDMILAAQKKLA